MSPDLFTSAGIVGAVIVVVAYFANQQRWLRSEDWQFPVANLVGSVLILASLSVAWNLPAAVIEAFWAAISLYGLARSKRTLRSG
ncbi:MAG: CBU_0592 family membrane protein [Acetobacteraceae bacterium]